jgi:uncharacterized RDD family membrane protein YckC
VALAVGLPLALLQGGFKLAPSAIFGAFSGFPFLVSVVGWFAYMTLMEGKTGASIGKRMMGLRVIGEDGSPVTIEASLIRNALRFLDAFPYVAPYALGAIVASKSPHRQRLGDVVAETLVVPAASLKEAPASSARASAPLRPASSPRGPAAPMSRGPVYVPGQGPAVPRPSVKPPTQTPTSAPAPAVHAPAKRRSKRPFVALAIVLVVLLGGFYAFNTLAGKCRVGGGAYDCDGVSFEYPDTWGVLDQARLPGSGNLSSVHVVGIDAQNNVEVLTYTLDAPVDASAIDTQKAGVAAMAADLAKGISGKVNGRPAKVTAGGLSGYQVRIKGTVGRTPLSIAAVALFTGSTEYVVECQFTSAHARDVRAACVQALHTFQAS